MGVVEGRGEEREIVIVNVVISSVMYEYGASGS